MTNSPKRLPKIAAAASEVTELSLSDVEAGIRDVAKTASGGYAISLTDAERLGLEPRRDDWSSGEVLTHTALASTGLDLIAERFGLVVSGPYLPPDENEDLYYLVAAPKAA